MKSKAATPDASHLATAAMPGATADQAFTQST